jgi:hypothetical protein
MFYMIYTRSTKDSLTIGFFFAHVLNKPTTTMQAIIRYKHASESFEPFDLDPSICVGDHN